MTAVFSAVLALACTAHSGDIIHCGTVVDDTGKPVGGARVVFATWRNNVIAPASAGPVAETDAAGQFQLPTPRAHWNDRSTFWVHGRGLALTSVNARFEPITQVVLKKPQPRTISIEGPDGKPVAGARISPRAVAFAGRYPGRALPDALVTALTVTTGPDGKATVQLPHPRRRTRRHLC